MQTCAGRPSGTQISAAHSQTADLQHLMKSVIIYWWAFMLCLDMCVCIMGVCGFMMTWMYACVFVQTVINVFVSLIIHVCVSAGCEAVCPSCVWVLLLLTRRCETRQSLKMLFLMWWCFGFIFLCAGVEMCVHTHTVSKWLIWKRMQSID